MRIHAVVLGTLVLCCGCGVPSFLITPVSSSNKLEEMRVDSGNAFVLDKIAIIEVEGMLANARTGGLLQAQENKLSLFTQQLQRAENDDRVKAVVLRINSPGGTVTCSDTMYDMIKRFRAKTHKPVVASAQEVCASGAYYLACGTDAIVANPTSVVGSIGVIFETLDASAGLSKIGLRFEAIKSGPLKDMGSPFKPLGDDARQVMTGLVDEYYQRFLAVVTSNRSELTDAEKIKTATDGRVFSGEQALELGLVDRIGRLEDAIELAKEMSNTPNAKVILYKRPYGYSGSIYANTSTPTPQANVLTLDLPETGLFLPTGFYYLWQP